MGVARLNLATISFDEEHHDELLMKLLEQEYFHPEPASKFAGSVQGLSVYNSSNDFDDILAKLEAMEERFNLGLKEVKVHKGDVNAVKAKELVDQYVEETEKICNILDQLENVAQENADAMIQLKYLANMDVNVDDLLDMKYLRARLGKMPKENIAKLEYYNTLPFLFNEFDSDGKNSYCMYLTLPNYAPEVDNIFSSLFFDRIELPSFIHGSVEEAIQLINEEDKDIGENGEKYRHEIRVLYQEHETELNQIYSYALHAKRANALNQYTVVVGKRLNVNGFVPKKDAKKFKTDLESIPGVSVSLRPADSDARLTPPTLLTGNWFSKPFKMFVEMYGVPSYNDVDPTVFVAISYCLLFGIMFGDVGQGIVLSLVGLFAYKKLHMQLGAVGIRLGVFSAIFGVVFGSVFGNEEILIPFFNAMDSNNTMTLIGAAIAVGVLLIVVAMLFNVFINIRKKNIGEALFSQNGLAGLIFYGAVLGIVIGMLTGVSIGGTVYEICFIALPLIVIFLKEALCRKLEGEEMFPNGFGAFAVEAFFELFEVCLTFVANTMSFLRVGGFVLSHAGMMLVVYTLAGMFGEFSIGYWVVLVIGNIFVMCLEGLIVGIQVLRLEFYEMFSRYYDGKGIPFKSLKN